MTLLLHLCNIERLITACAVAKSDPDPGGALPAGHASPPSAKRPAKSAGLQDTHTPTAKKAKHDRPEKGTIDSFLARKG